MVSLFQSFTAFMPLPGWLVAVMCPHQHVTATLHTALTCFRYRQECANDICLCPSSRTKITAHVCALIGRPFVTVRPVLSDRCLSVLSVLSCPVLSVCNVSVLWSNGWMDQNETWHADTSRSWPHCIRRGPSSPPKGARPPNFRSMSIVGKRLGGSRCHLVWR